MLKALKLTKEQLSLSAYLKLSSFICCIFMAVISYGQLSFQVIDEQGLPMIGVEAYSTDYALAAVSDNKGKITLSILPDADDDTRITIKYLGYQKLVVTVSELADLDDTIVLAPDSNLLEEIVLIGRNEIAKEALPYHIESIARAEIASTNPQTSADALAQHGQLYVQKSQMGGGSPVIRGFEANKVLLVLDGIRMNNAIYRNGHLQNAITVDPAMLERVDVIFGPNSLTYGSDALGGVVHFKTRDPDLQYLKTEELYTEGNYSLRYSSANQEKTGHLDFNLGGQRVASLTSLSFSDFSDLRMGARRTEQFPDFGLRTHYVSRVNSEDIELINPDPNVQIGTGYHQIDFAQKLLYQPDDNFQLIANLQYSTSSDIPRYDQLIDRSDGKLTFAEWNYGPQKRTMASVKFKFLQETSFYDKAIFIAAMQEVEEDRISRRFGRDDRSHQNEEVTVQSFTADFNKSLSTRHHIYYGANFQHDFVRSKAFDENIITGKVLQDVLTRYPSGGSEMTMYGLYLQYHLSTAKDQGHLNTGLRYSGTRLAFSYSEDDPIKWPDRFIDGLNSNNASLIWSIGWTQHYPQGWKWRALASTAFRSPNIDDIAKIRVKGEEVTFPNPELGPERSLNFEYSMGKDFRSSGRKLGSISMTGFYTKLNNAIIRAPFQDNDGSSVFTSGGDSYNILANVNAKSAIIHGFSFTGEANLWSRLEINGSLNITKGKVLSDQTDGEPLAHIPPIYGQLGFKYDMPKVGLRADYRFNCSKPIEEYGGSADNPEFATPIGALAWQTFNLYGEYKLMRAITFSLGVENILDQHYRQFASGVNAAGRNIIISVRGQF